MSLFDYDKQLYVPQTVETMLHTVASLLEQVIDDQTLTLEDLQLRFMSNTDTDVKNIL